jgi:hypothetical protein
MNPKEIRDYITEQSNAVGIDPALSLGLAELTGFSPKWTDGRSAGIMSLPKDGIADMEAYQANPRAQIDAGLLALSKNLEDTGNEFGALAQYTSNPSRAFKAYLRTARNKGQAVTADEIAQSMQALGLDLDPIDEARKANLPIAQPKPMQAPMQEPMQQAMPQQEQQPQVEPLQEPESFITSTPKERKDRVEMIFGGNDKDGDVPADLIAYIKGLM